MLGAYGSDIDDLEKLIKEQQPTFSKKIVVRFDHPSVKDGHCPPFFISMDDDRREVALYMRGLNLLHKDDYVALMSNRKSEKVSFHSFKAIFSYTVCRNRVEPVGYIFWVVKPIQGLGLVFLNAACPFLWLLSL